MAGNDASRKFCVDRGIGLIRATNESGNTAGGFLAPQDFDAAIIAIRETVGAFRQGAETRPSSSDNQVRPRRVGGVTANFVGEGASIPESQLQFDAVGTTQRKLAVLCRDSSELFEDSAADLAEFLTTEIAYAFAGTEDDCGFNGDGSSAFSRISGLGTKLVGLKSAVAAASAHNTFLTIDTTDIANLMASVLATAIPGAAWYTSATGYPLRGIIDQMSTGRDDRGFGFIIPDDGPMFDSAAPRLSGNLAGESFASVLENHPSYPNLRSGRHRALFELLDDIVANHIDSLAGILQGLGFDEVGTKIYRSAALRAFRAVLPTN